MRAQKALHGNYLSARAGTASHKADLRPVIRQEGSVCHMTARPDNSGLVLEQCEIALPPCDGEPGELAVEWRGRIWIVFTCSGTFWDDVAASGTVDDERIIRIAIVAVDVQVDVV